MSAVRSLCRCGSQSQGLIKQIGLVKPLIRNVDNVSFVQGLSVRKLATQRVVDDNVQKFKAGNYETIPDPKSLQHFKKNEDTISAVATGDPPPIGTHALPHPIWSEEELHSVEVTHKPPEGIVDRMAYYSVKVMRKTFDTLSGFNRGERNERRWVLRICFLETVAGVPGMVAAMLRHLSSLRRMQRDYGWIHTLLEEAENERMHLMTALQLRQPSNLFRLCVVGAQGTFVTMFSLAYLMSPRFCHRFVGYLEEEAVVTYSKCLQDIQKGSMQHWKTQAAPEIAISYWKLQQYVRCPLNSDVPCCNFIESFIDIEPLSGKIWRKTLCRQKKISFSKYGTVTDNVYRLNISTYSFSTFLRESRIEISSYDVGRFKTRIEQMLDASCVGMISLTVIASGVFILAVCILCWPQAKRKVHPFILEQSHNLAHSRL
ncbi:Hypothetical predicted protein [Mytilus galloprovincialis]|uniref:Alternative oxidase n=1 Tax=Mytilus galloprovincialis TaxID=29158 RepID=A0A8B6BX46_MYTGA|nr:Hypothetical predicted protein [Mytilus galloprovincialis]